MRSKRYIEAPTQHGDTEMNKHTATDRNGLVHTRNSQGRAYTHCVAVRPSYERALAEAQKGWKNAASDYAYFAERAAGRLEQYRWEDEGQFAIRLANEVKHAQEQIAGCANAAEYVEKTRAEMIARVEARKAKGYYDTFEVIGWNGRLDLAQKEAARQHGRADLAEVCILEATVTQSKKKVVA